MSVGCIHGACIPEWAISIKRMSCAMARLPCCSARISAVCPSALRRFLMAPAPRSVATTSR
eukprot:6380133-Prymnesium_polylepis.1